MSKATLSPDEEIAFKVLVKTDYVRNWALGELRAYGIRPESVEGVKFIRDKSKHIAFKILGKS